mmetsp:Transcript_37801/g.90429  ORF Transcript_37801/g.90429 Transcript_37801/m.90429 type:complete len:131 (+) Transcript_37801:923-1315(+)
MLSPHAINTKQSISAKLASFEAADESLPTAKVYAVRPVDVMRSLVRASWRLNEYEFDVVAIKTAIVVASFALLTKKYLLRSVRERYVDNVVSLVSDRGEPRTFVFKLPSRGEYDQIDIGASSGALHRSKI